MLCIALVLYNYNIENSEERLRLLERTKIWPIEETIKLASLTIIMSGTIQISNVPVNYSVAAMEEETSTLGAPTDFKCSY